MKSRRFVLAVFILMNFVVSMTGTVFGSILDKLALALQVPVEQAGLLNTAFSYGAGLGVPLVLIALRGLRRSLLLKGMLLVTLVVTLALMTVNRFSLMLAARFIMGLSMNSYGAVAMSMAVALAPRQQQGRALALYIMGSSLALVLGLPLIRLLSAVLDWRAIFGILAGLMLFSLICFQFVLPSGDEAPPPKINIRQELAYLKNPRTPLILLFTLTMFIGSGSMYIFMTAYLVTLFPALDSLMSLVLLGLGLSSLLGNMLGGAVSDRIGYRRSMLIGGLLQLCLALGLLLSQRSQWLSLCFALLWLMSVWFTGLQPNAGIVRETNNRSNFMLSLNGSAVQLGYALGTSLASLIIAGAGISQIVYIAILSSACISLLQLFSMHRYGIGTAVAPIAPQG